LWGLEYVLSFAINSAQFTHYPLLIWRVFEIMGHLVSLFRALNN
jgi:hypothetical protein